MPLTPSDVSNKLFDKAFRGYAMDEVDAFLDEVEGELTRLLTERAELQSRIGGKAVAPTDVPGTPTATGAASTAAPTAAASAGSTTPDGPAVSDGSTALNPPKAAVRAPEESQDAALRTLLMAQRTADQAIAEARAEAEVLLLEARAAAEQELEQARTEAELFRAQGQQRSDEFDQEVQERTTGVLAALQTREGELEARIEQMRAFEREYRLRLKAYLESQLRDLEAGPGPSTEGAAELGLSGSPASTAEVESDAEVEPGTSPEHAAVPAPQPLGPFSPEPSASTEALPQTPSVER